jgi:site-specific recombinase XerD
VLRLHDLRHTFSLSLVSNGVSLPIIGELLGHRQPSTTARYAHVAPEVARKAANVFGNREFGT